MESPSSLIRLSRSMLLGCVLAFCCTGISLEAKPVTFAQFPGHITVPDDWTVKPLPGNAGSFSASLGNAALTESISVYICTTQSTGPLSDDSQYVKGFLQTCADHQATVSGHQHEKVGGVDFYVLNVVQKMPSVELDMMVWMTLSDGHIYQIGCYQKNGDPAKNSDYTSIMNSFSPSQN